MFIFLKTWYFQFWFLYKNMICFYLISGATSDFVRGGGEIWFLTGWVGGQPPWLKIFKNKAGFFRIWSKQKKKYFLIVERLVLSSIIYQILIITMTLCLLFSGLVIITMYIKSFFFVIQQLVIFVHYSLLIVGLCSPKY